MYNINLREPCISQWFWVVCSHITPRDSLGERTNKGQIVVESSQAKLLPKRNRPSIVPLSNTRVKGSTLEGWVYVISLEANQKAQRYYVPVEVVQVA